MKISELPKDLVEQFRKGVVIPAHPLSLTEDKQIDEEDMQLLARYYIDAGVGGIAVGVHTTQFEIRDPDVNLLEPVLKFTSNCIDDYCTKKGKQILKISGVCGETKQAVQEAELSKSLGFHAVLLSLSALKDKTIDEMVEHCATVAKVMPIIGFYLQPAVGGRTLPYEFWYKFCKIENVLGIKMAPFNRYQTFDVVRGLCEAGAENRITLYTGNDDNIVLDLITPYKINTSRGDITVRVKGGLLGHWCVWTNKAVQLLEECHKYSESNSDIPQELLTRAIQVTDSNAVFFDAANAFHGCIPGVHEVLKRNGLMKSIRCLNPNELLSPGQADEITRVSEAYPHLTDDDFIRNNIVNWKE